MKKRLIFGWDLLLNLAEQNLILKFLVLLAKKKRSISSKETNIMTKELESKLAEKYPKILCDYGKSEMEACMHWGNI